MVQDRPPPVTDASVRVPLFQFTKTKARERDAAAALVVSVIVFLDTLSVVLPRFLSKAID